MRVVSDVLSVIVEDEITAQHWPKHKEDSACQQTTAQKYASRIVCADHLASHAASSPRRSQIQSPRLPFSRGCLRSSLPPRRLPWQVADGKITLSVLRPFSPVGKPIPFPNS